MGPDQEVMFEEEQISLDIPEEGIVLESGWRIIPHTYPGVSSRCTNTRQNVYSQLRTGKLKCDALVVSATGLSSCDAKSVMKS